MVNFILISHADFSIGLLNSAEMIMGKQENVIALTLNEDDSVEVLEETLEKELKHLSNSGEVIILVDLLGASPFNVSFRLIQKHQDAKLVAGMNLPMFLEDLINLRTIGRRNNTLCNIMRELGFIESRGRGMSKIISPKTVWKKAPEFYSGNDFFMVTLYSRHYGKIHRDDEINLDQTDMEILKVLKHQPTITQRELSEYLKISRRTLTNRLNKLYSSNVIKKEGSSQQTRYHVLIEID